MQIRFTFDSEFGQFSDALNLPDDHTFTDVELETMKQERLANWIAIITAPPTEELPPEELPPEELPPEELLPVEEIPTPDEVI
jgi:hypothetical protein